MPRTHHWFAFVAFLPLACAGLAACGAADGQADDAIVEDEAVTEAVPRPVSGTAGFGAASVRVGTREHAFKVVDCIWPGERDKLLLLVSGVSPGVPDADARVLADTDPMRDPEAAQAMLERAYIHGPVLAISRIQDVGETVVVMAGHGGVPYPLAQGNSETPRLRIDGQGRPGAEIAGVFEAAEDAQGATTTIEVSVTCP